MRVLDGACMVFDGAVGGVQPQSKPCGVRPNKYKVPRLAFVNKMDRRAGLLQVVDQMKDSSESQTQCRSLFRSVRRYLCWRGRSDQDEGHYLG